MAFAFVVFLAFIAFIAFFAFVVFLAFAFVVFRTLICFRRAAVLSAISFLSSHFCAAICCARKSTLCVNILKRVSSPAGGQAGRPASRRAGRQAGKQANRPTNLDHALFSEQPPPLRVPMLALVGGHGRQKNNNDWMLEPSAMCGVHVVFVRHPSYHISTTFLLHLLNIC